MIDKRFLDSASAIRKQYLKLTNNFDLYSGAAKKLSTDLEQTIAKMTELSEGKEIPAKETISKLADILNDIEVKSKALEEQIAPINEEISLLAEEEKVLYNKIKERHPDLSDEEIVKSVRERLETDGLL